MEEIIETIGELCIQKSVQLVDIPEFVFKFVQCKVPFQENKGKVSGKVFKFDYSDEVKRKKDIKDALPDSFYLNLYEFQRKGIEFGV